MCERNHLTCINVFEYYLPDVLLNNMEQSAILIIP